MSWIVIVVLGAIALLLFIVIRRLPATRNYNPQTRGGSFWQTLGRFGRGFGRIWGYVAAAVISASSWVLTFFKGLFMIIGARLKLVRVRQGRSRPKATPEEALAQQLKSPEHRSFWVEGENKEEIPTSHIIASTLFEQAEDAFRGQDFRRAETLYLEAARENPHNAKIFNRLGIIYLERQNYGDAIEAFVTALQYDEKVASRHFNLALAYLGQGNYTMAVKSLKRAVELAPDQEKYQKILEEAQKKC